MSKETPKMSEQMRRVVATQKMCNDTMLLLDEGHFPAKRAKMVHNCNLWLKQFNKYFLWEIEQLTKHEKNAELQEKTS